MSFLLSPTTWNVVGIAVEAVGVVVATTDVIRTNQRTIDGLRASQKQAVEIISVIGDIKFDAIYISDGTAEPAGRISGMQAKLKRIMAPDLSALPNALAQRKMLWIGAVLVGTGIIGQIIGALTST